MTLALAGIPNFSSVRSAAGRRMGTGSLKNKYSSIQETLNLSTDADSSTYIKMDSYGQKRTIFSHMFFLQGSKILIQ